MSWKNQSREESLLLNGKEESRNMEKIIFINMKIEKANSTEGIYYTVIDHLIFLLGQEKYLIRWFQKCKRIDFVNMFLFFIWRVIGILFFVFFFFYIYWFSLENFLMLILFGSMRVAPQRGLPPEYFFSSFHRKKLIHF